MVLDALFFRLRNAGPWRDLPDGFGPWRTIYGWYQRLARQGIWERLLWRRTKASQEWLAEKLQMSSAANVSQQLRRLDKKRAEQVAQSDETFSGGSG